MAAGTGEAGEEEVRLKLCRVAQDEICALPRAGERQPDYVVAEIGVGLYDGVLGALGFFDALAALAVGGVNGGPPGREKDWIAIAAGVCLLAQMLGKSVADEVGAGEGIADAAIEVGGRCRPHRCEA